MSGRLLLDRVLGHSWIAHPFGIEVEFGQEGVGRWVLCRRCNQLRREQVETEPVVHRTFYVVRDDERAEIEGKLLAVQEHWKAAT